MITSVYGKCDEYDVIFKQYGGMWHCCVPPDWQDGQYVCEFYATTDAGVQGYWTGIVYISANDSICPKLVEDIFAVWVLPESKAILEEERTAHTLVSIRREQYAANDVTA